MKRIESIFQSLVLFLRWTSMILVLGLTVVVFFSVFFRYVLNSPIIWSDEVIMISMLCLTYFGSALASHRGKHINVDLLEALIGRKYPRMVSLSRRVNDIICIIVLISVAVFAVKLSIFSKDQHTDILYLSYFWIYSILTVGLIFMILIIGQKILDEWKK